MSERKSKIDWRGNVGFWNEYKFIITYNEKFDRWISSYEQAPMRAIWEIGRHYTSNENAKWSCYDFIEKIEKEK